MIRILLILSIYYSVIFANVVSEFRFDEESWNQTLDEVVDSSSGYNGTSFTTLDTDSKLCNGADFSVNARTDYITINKNALHGLDDLSISIWIKTSKTSGQQEILQALGSSRSDDEIELYLENNNKLIVTIRDRHKTFTLDRDELTDNNWHNLVFTRKKAIGFMSMFSKGTGCLYIDGQKKECKRNSFQNGALNIHDNALILGQEQDSYGGSFDKTQDFEGYIDELVTFNTALSDAEVLKIYNNYTHNLNHDGSNRECSSFVEPTINYCYSDDFSINHIGTHWKIIKNENFTPEINSSKLLLTNSNSDIATGLNLDAHFPANNNYIEIEFEHNAYGGTGADGTVLVLSDANETPIAGAYGGSLGYANRSGFDGFNGGWMGIGFDEFGNYSNPTEGRNGGVGQIQDSIAIRGSSNAIIPYQYIAGTATLLPGIDNTSSLSPSPSYKYKVIIDTRDSKNIVTVKRDTGSGYQTLPSLNRINATQTAISPTDFTLSFTASTGGENNYHSIDSLSISAIDCGTLPDLLSSEEETSGFVVYEESKNLSDQNLSTKIVNQSFNFTLASVDDNKTSLEDFNGTVCSRILDTLDSSYKSDWSESHFISAQSKQITFTTPSAVKRAKVFISWKKDVYDSCPLIMEDKSTTSSDLFAIRPYKFNLNQITQAYAGENFLLSSDAYDINLNNTTDYNESLSSLNLSANELNISAGIDCKTGTETFNHSNTNFKDGLTADFNSSFSGLAKYLNLTLKEEAGSEFAIVDALDTNDSQRFIEPNELNITVLPYELNVTLSEIKASTNSNWIYMANLNDMNISVGAKIQANNKQHQILKDFNSTCYAKDINITFKLKTDGNNSLDINYTTNNIFSDGSTFKNQTLGDINQTVTILATNIKNGVGDVNLTFNVDRKYFNPINPFSISGVGVDINSTNISKYNYNNSDFTDGNITFFYARLKVKDIESTQDETKHIIEIEVYNNTPSLYTTGFTQNSLNWYKSKNHSNKLFGDIITIEASKNSILGAVPVFNVTDIDEPSNGEIYIKIDKLVGTYTLHIQTQSWLWYILKNYGKEYDYTSSSNCTQHPCFSYTYKDIELLKNISSGKFQGGDFIIKTNNNHRRRGVKLFR